MIPAYYLAICFLAQSFLLWLVLQLQASEHRATAHALTARNAQDLRMLESPPVPARKLRPARVVSTEGEFAEPTKIRPLGL